MVSLEVVKSIVGNKKSIVCGGKEWREIVKLLPSGISDNEKYIFLSGDDLNSDSIFDLLFECGVEVVYN
jgi:hypothetical protein